MQNHIWGPLSYLTKNYKELNQETQNVYLFLVQYAKIEKTMIWYLFFIERYRTKMIGYAELMDAILTKAYCKPYTEVLLAKIQCLLFYYKDNEDVCRIQN